MDTGRIILVVVQLFVLIVVLSRPRPRTRADWHRTSKTLLTPLGLFQNFPQLLLLVLSKRRFENFSLESFQFLQYLVRGNLSHENKES